jgi:hypothetical protein
MTVCVFRQQDNPNGWIFPQEINLLKIETLIIVEIVYFIAGNHNYLTGAEPNQPQKDSHGQEQHFRVSLWLKHPVPVQSTINLPQDIDGACQ